MNKRLSNPASRKNGTPIHTYMTMMMSKNGLGNAAYPAKCSKSLAQPMWRPQP